MLPGQKCTKLSPQHQWHLPTAFAACSASPSFTSRAACSPPARRQIGVLDKLCGGDLRAGAPTLLMLLNGIRSQRFHLINWKEAIINDDASGLELQHLRMRDHLKLSMLCIRQEQAPADLESSARASAQAADPLLRRGHTVPAEEAPAHPVSGVAPPQRFRLHPHALHPQWRPGTTQRSCLPCSAPPCNAGLMQQERKRRSSCSVSPFNRNAYPTCHQVPGMI